MRIAIISDIHGNIFALEAVMQQIRKLSCDAIVNLGDILYGPISPLETYEFLQTVGCITIQGNQDRDLYQANSEQIATNPTLAWNLERLGKEAIHWLRSLPTSFVLDDIFICHGSPDNDCIYLLEDIDTGFPRVRTDRAIQQRLADVTAPVVLCGHSHLPRTVWLESGQLVVNPGSVGLPAYQDLEPKPHIMETCSPHARFSVLEKARDGWQVTEHRIAYPHREAALLARDRGRPDWAYALMTGRAVVRN